MAGELDGVDGLFVLTVVSTKTLVGTLITVPITVSTQQLGRRPQ